MHMCMYSSCKHTSHMKRITFRVGFGHTHTHTPGSDWLKPCPHWGEHIWECWQQLGILHEMPKVADNQLNLFFFALLLLANTTVDYRHHVLEEVDSHSQVTQLGLSRINLYCVTSYSHFNWHMKEDWGCSGGSWWSNTSLRLDLTPICECGVLNGINLLFLSSNNCINTKQWFILLINDAH